MKRNPILGAAILLVVAVIPAASAKETQSNVFSMPDLERLNAEVLVTLTGEDAQEARQDSDLNQDGTVSSTEADQVESSSRSLFEQLFTGGAQVITLDGSGPSDAELTDYGFDNLEGSVTSAQPVQLMLEGYTTYDSADPTLAAHIMTFGGEQDEDAEPTHGQLTVPPGYVIVDAKGLENRACSDGGKTVAGDSQGAEPTVITFSKSGKCPYQAKSDGGGDSPGPTALLGVLALAGVAAIVRRK